MDEEAPDGATPALATGATQEEPKEDPPAADAADEANSDDEESDSEGSSPPMRFLDEATLDKYFTHIMEDTYLSL